MTKYVSLEHAIRNAVRDQQYKKPLNEDKEWEKDSAAVKASKDPEFINKMIDYEDASRIVNEIINRVCIKAEIIPVGSFRRKMKKMKDIDFLIISNKKDVLQNLSFKIIMYPFCLLTNI
jgi:DNA polymerase/3'-5' exonuclease PolX